MADIEWAPMKTGFKVSDMKLRMDQTYNRKPSLKASYQDLELTPEQELEFVKCAMDCEYFVRNYYRITSIDRGFILFEPHDYQVEIINAFQENRFNVICQCRQSGKTTVVAAILLWYALFHEDKEIAVLANKEKAAKEVLDRMQKALLDMPFFLQQGVTKFGATEMCFENGSKCFAYATSADSIRGRSIACLYIDEFAFVQGDEEFWESSFPAIASAETSKCILTSTPKGQRGMFYNIWEGADPDENGETNGFHKTLVTWQQVPNYATKEGWEESTRKRLGDSRFDQEFGCIWKDSEILLNDPNTGIMFKTTIEQAYKMMENPTHVVYRHTNKITGKQYVGITNGTMQSRWKTHVRSAINGNSNLAFHCAIRKYGAEGFEHEILYVSDTKDYKELERFEKHYIIESDCLLPNGYNMTAGGTMGLKYTEEHKKNLSKNTQGYVLERGTRLETWL